MEMEYLKVNYNFGLYIMRKKYLNKNEKKVPLSEAWWMIESSSEAECVKGEYRLVFCHNWKEKVSK